MRVVVQRVKEAEVKVAGRVIGAINQGLLIFLAIHKDDTEEKIFRLVDKIVNLRIFADSMLKMNKSLLQVGGEALVISQFTLYGDCQKGNRPSFIKSARPEQAVPMYEIFIRKLRGQGVKVESGEFGAMMDVGLINDGPVTIIYDI